MRFYLRTPIHHGVMLRKGTFSTVYRVERGLVSFKFACLRWNLIVRLLCCRKLLPTVLIATCSASQPTISETVACREGHSWRNTNTFVLFKGVREEPHVTAGVISRKRDTVSCREHNWNFILIIMLNVEMEFSSISLWLVDIFSSLETRH